MNDPHRRTVYLMERREFRGIWKWSRVPLKTRRSILRRLCKMYDVPVIPMVSRRFAGQSGAYCADKNRLEFDPKDGADIITFSHEVAHYIATYRHGTRVQDHGRTWLTYYAKVLSSLRIMPIAGMQTVCKRYGLRLTPASQRAYKGHSC